MANTRILLSSGNTFYYLEANSDVISTAFIVDTQKNFLGGFAGQEADRKFKAFSSLNNVIVEETNEVPSMDNLKYDQFKEWIGTASRLFENGLNFYLCDNVHGAQGTSSASRACDERQYYFKVVGLDMLFRSDKKCPVWALIANHLSIFGSKEFRETFFRGRDLESAKSDDAVACMYISRYYGGSFKAPAYYIRMALQNGISAL
jgi:hypothetical protein